MAMAMDIRRWMYECLQCLQSCTDAEDLQRHTLFHLQEKIIHNHTSGHYLYPDVGQNPWNVVHNNNYQVSSRNAEYLTLNEEQQPARCPSGTGVFQTSVDLKTHEELYADVVQLMHDDNVYRTTVDDITSLSMNGPSGQLSNFPAYQSCYISPVMTGDLSPLVTTPLPEVQADTNPHHSLHHGKEFTTSSSLERPNELLQGVNWHRCLECGLQFLSNAGLVTHAKTHTNQKSESCPVCNEVFKASECLLQHMKIHHDNKKGHVCSYCGKAFTKQSHLDKHFKFHTKPLSETFYETKCKFTDASAKELRVVTRVKKKKKKCHICYKMFRTATDVSRHIMIHTGERPFQCSFCRDGFIILHSLKIHTIRCHQMDKTLVESQEVTGSQILPEIDKRTPLNETPNLITHNSTLPVLRCCNTTFSTLLEIQQHYLVHNEEKPFVCPHCEMAFTKVYTRTKHIMKKHAGVKPNCLDCGQEFSQFQDLMKHMKVHEEQIINQGLPHIEPIDDPRVEVCNNVVEEEPIDDPRVEVCNKVVEEEPIDDPRVEVCSNVVEELDLNPLMLMEMGIPDTSRPLSPREEEILDALM